MTGIVREVTIGPCRLILGDCLECLPLVGRVDACVTDPPYGKGFHDGGISEVPTGKWSSPKPAKFAGAIIAGDNRPDTTSLRLIYEAIKDGGAMYVFSQWMTEPDWIEGLKCSGFKTRNRLIWSKPFHGAGDLQTTFGPMHESILFATRGRHELRGTRDGDVWNEPVGPNGCFRKGQEHPNQKPLELIEYLIRKSSDDGDIVLDPFMGSGTTGVACIRTDRQFIGIEKEPKYFDIAVRRVEQAWQLKCSELPFDEPPKLKQRELLEVNS